MLLALGRFDTLIEQTEAALEANPYDSNNVAYAVRLYVAAGQRKRAGDAIDAYVKLLEPSEGEAEI